MTDTEIKDGSPAIRFESPDRDDTEKAADRFVDNTDEDEEFSYAEQRKIIHRIDRRLVVILGLMYEESMDRRVPSDLESRSVLEIAARTLQPLGTSETLLTFYLSV